MDVVSAYRASCIVFHAPPSRACAGPAPTNVEDTLGQCRCLGVIWLVILGSFFQGTTSYCHTVEFHQHPRRMVTVWARRGQLAREPGVPICLCAHLWLMPAIPCCGPLFTRGPLRGTSISLLPQGKVKGPLQPALPPCHPFYRPSRLDLTTHF